MAFDGDLVVVEGVVVVDDDETLGGLLGLLAARPLLGA